MIYNSGFLGGTLSDYYGGKKRSSRRSRRSRSYYGGKKVSKSSSPYHFVVVQKRKKCPKSHKKTLSKKGVKYCKRVTPRIVHH